MRQHLISFFHFRRWGSLRTITSLGVFQHLHPANEIWGVGFSAGQKGEQGADELAAEAHNTEREQAKRYQVVQATVGALFAAEGLAGDLAVGVKDISQDDRAGDTTEQLRHEVRRGHRDHTVGCAPDEKKLRRCVVHEGKEEKEEEDAQERNKGGTARRAKISRHCEFFRICCRRGSEVVGSQCITGDARAISVGFAIFAGGG